MRTKKLILDLDGVFVDFVGAAFKTFDITLSGLGEYPKRAGWNVVKALNILRREQGLYPVSDDQFWGRFDEDFWSHLQWYPGAVQLYETVIKAFGAGNVWISTSATLQPSCAAGKLKWVDREMPEIGSARTFIGRDKWLLAGPDRVLLDDRDKNCLMFSEAGGLSVLVPRPWNMSSHVEDTNFHRTISTLHLLNVSLPE